MSTPNYTLERVGYKVEATTGTKVITAAGDTTYSFGIDVEPEGGKEAHVMPSPKFTKDVAFTYNSREAASATTIFNGSSFSCEIKNVMPVLAVPWNMLLGTPTDAAPDTIQVKDTGLKKSYTVHGEHNDGTNPFTRDLVGAYLTKLKWHWDLGKPLTIDLMHFDGWSIQDEDSTTASVHLTNAPTLDNTALFTDCTEIKWDTGGDNETLSNVYRIDFESGHGITASKVSGTGANAARKVYPNKFGSRTTTGHKFFMSCILDTHNQYDDLRNQNQVNVTMTMKKADGSDYIKFLYGGVDILDITKGIPRGGGYSERMLICEANTLSLEFDDGVSVFATYYS